LRNKLSYLCLALLTIGIICIAVSEVNLRSVKNVKIGQEYMVWSSSWNLTRGSTYGVDIVGADDWSLPFGKGDFTSPQPVNLTITSPGGDVTSLQAFYYGLPSTSPYYQIGTPASIVEVTYQNVDDAALMVDRQSTQIRFTVKQTGSYNISVVQQGLWSQEPPDYILIWEEVAPNKETYTLLATGGGVAGTLGGIAFIASLFRSQNAKHKRARIRA
jgi:hypothetical protein